MAGFSQSLASYLGVTRAANLTTDSLEARARLFFAASQNGRSVPRTDQEFDQHYRNEVALIEQLRGEGGDSAVYTELERRLRSAATGGDISGVDGMAIFDVFMRVRSLVDPALLFVLSHELGHVVLGHAPFPEDLSCAERQQREDDADAFAVALLVYDVPGDLETGAAALATLGLAEPPNADDDKLEYGYPHAVQYGFSLAGLTNQIGPNCSYRGATDRVTRLDQLRKDLIAKRVKAMVELYRYFRAYPPYIYTSDDIEDLRPAQKRAYAIKLFARCRAGQPGAAVRFHKLVELPFGSVVACPNRLARRFANAEFATRLGTETVRQIRAEYARKVPVIFSDVTIDAFCLHRRRLFGRV